MAQYKVPQDVEADDKLIGPFSFRQFVYLLIVAGLIALAVLLAQLFPLLAIIPVPLILLFGALALPLRKDQPMETYLAALISYYLKPRKRIWTPGQRESTILITAPKVVEENRARDISGEEATHRLSFLADIVDSQGHSIQEGAMREDLMAEANATEDMFDSYRSSRLGDAIEKDSQARHNELVNEMRQAFSSQQSTYPIPEPQPISHTYAPQDTSVTPMTQNYASMAAPEVPTAAPISTTIYNSPSVVQPGLPPEPEPEPEPEPVPEPEPIPEMEPEPEKNTSTIPPEPGIIETANSSDLPDSADINQANTTKGKDDGEVFISLH